MAVDFARAEQLLNFDVKFDIELLDQLVHVMNTSTGAFLGFGCCA